MTSRSIDWTYLDPSAPVPVQVGDIVCAEAGGMPIYRVTGLEADRLWVSPGFGKGARPVQIERFRWKARPD
jgi:hypothetical protein